MSDQQAKPNPFVIKIPIAGLEPLGLELEIDLSQEQYKQQVMSAAGRWAALARRHPSGPTALKESKCGCGRIMGVRAMREHKKTCPEA